MKFGWREAAKSAADVDEADEADVEPEVDPEFEDACLALAMTSGPKLDGPDLTESGPEDVDTPVEPAAPVATAAELAEDVEEDADVRATFLPPPPLERARMGMDFDPRSGWGSSPQVSPEEAIPEVDSEVSPETNTGLINADAELAATKAELESLRADFQAERFRARDERVRLEDELAAARGRSALVTDHLLGDGGEVQELQREVDALRGELADSRSRHAEELAQLGTDLKAAQARDAQSVIAAQLAHDELKAVRADHEATQEALQTTQSEGVAGQADLEAANAAFDDSLKTSARELSAARAERDALRQLLNEVDAKESALAAGWDAERRALQDEISGASDAADQRVRQVEAQLAERENDLRIARESAADLVRALEGQLAAKDAELAATQQELLDAEERRAEEAASFLKALQE